MKGSGSGIASWMLKSYADMIGGFYPRRKEARSLVDTLPELPVEVTVPDSGAIYGWIEGLCSTPHRRPGTQEGHRGEDFVIDRFEEFGLEDITREPIDITVWDARNWGLSVWDGERKTDIPSFRVQNTGFTGEHGVTAPLVYVGKAWLPGALKRADVRGKIVVADVPFPTLPAGLLLKLLGGGYGLSDPAKRISLGTRMKLIFVPGNFPGQFLNIDIDDTHIPLGDMRLPWDVYWRAHQQGARGVVLILSNMPTNSNTHFGPYDACMKPIPALWVGKYDGEELRSLAKSGAKATLILEGEERPGVTHNIWGTLPGRSEEMIILHSHHDAPFQGATEDGCGVGQILAQARAWSQVPERDRPKTLMFLCAAAHFYGPALGVYEFVKRHKHDFLARTDVVICLEHLGAKQMIEKDREFVPCGEQAITWVMTSSNKYVIAAIMKALKEQRLKQTVAIPYNLIAPVPTTDAFPYPFGDVQFLSWIAQPYYLLNAEDTLDKIEVAELGPIAESVTELVKTFMALDSCKIGAAVP
ncbi:MAG: M28 family peptidase [Actinobacteria bacterium]|nr:M28 family peptidase [Actinomycetota bacterium]